MQCIRKKPVKYSKVVVIYLRGLLKSSILAYANEGNDSRQSTKQNKMKTTEIKRLLAQAKKVQESNSFVDAFLLLIKIENKRYIFTTEELSFEEWDNIKSDLIELFNLKYDLYFDTSRNDLDNLINYITLAKALETK